MTRLVLGLLVVALAGCAIHQRVEPVPKLAGPDICIVENPSVRAGFLEEYRRALAGKGYRVKLLERSAAVDECSITSTYTANWRWDLALYMAYAQITVYAEGRKVGSAVYDSLGGSGNLGKFISADTKIRELVDQLFPNSAPSRPN